MYWTLKVLDFKVSLRLLKAHLTSYQLDTIFILFRKYFLNADNTVEILYYDLVRGETEKVQNSY